MSYNGIVARKVVNDAIVKGFDEDLKLCLDGLRQAMATETDPAEREKGRAMIRRLERELGEDSGTVS